MFLSSPPPHTWKAIFEEQVVSLYEQSSTQQEHPAPNTADPEASAGEEAEAVGPASVQAAEASLPALTSLTLAPPPVMNEVTPCLPGQLPPFPPMAGVFTKRSRNRRFREKHVGVFTKRSRNATPKPKDEQSGPPRRRRRRRRRRWWWWLWWRAPGRHWRQRWRRDSCSGL